MFVLSFLEEIQVSLVTQQKFVRAVQGTDARGIDLVGIPDVQSVEIESQHHTHADGGAVHHASIELVLGSVIEEAGIDVGSPRLQVCPHQCVGNQRVLRLPELQAIAP